MNFETMIGTTGIASDGEKLFIANNTVITIIDREDKKKDIPHGYDRIEDIAVSGGFLSGIYVKDDKYGIFLLQLDLNLNNPNFTNLDTLSYEPYRILIETSLSESKPLITTIDDKFNKYQYDSRLKEITKISGGVVHYNEVDIAVGPNQEYFMSTEDIKPVLSGNKLPIELNGELLKIHLYNLVQLIA